MNNPGTLATKDEKEDLNSESSDEIEKGVGLADEEGRNDKKVAEMLQLSQKHLERNCNAICNNLSLLTLHTFEMGNYV